MCVAGDAKPSLAIAALLPSAGFSSAACLVTDTINSVLPEYHIELIEVITGECYSGALTSDRYGPLVEVVSTVTHKVWTIIGVVGLVCTGLLPTGLLPSVIENILWYTFQDLHAHVSRKKKADSLLFTQWFLSMMFMFQQ